MLMLQVEKFEVQREKRIFYSSESIEDLLDELPLVASNLSYHVYKVDQSMLGLNGEYTLKTLFPRLLNSDFMI